VKIFKQCNLPLGKKALTNASTTTNSNEEEHRGDNLQTVATENTTNAIEAIEITRAGRLDFGTSSSS
jgi:hypothetical protein